MSSFTAVAAVAASDIVLVAALRTVDLETAGRHRDKKSFGPFDDLHVPDDKTSVKSHIDKSPEFFRRIFLFYDADLGDLHGGTLYRL